MSSPSDNPAWPDTGQFIEEERRRVDAFVHDVAHDLRSPVRRMRNFAQLIEQRLHDDTLDVDELGEFMERIVSCAAELDGRVTAMVDRHVSVT